MARLKISFTEPGRRMPCELVLLSEEFRSPDQVRVLLSRLFSLEPVNMDALTDERLRAFLLDGKDQELSLPLRNRAPGEARENGNEDLRRRLIACNDRLQGLQSRIDALEGELRLWQTGAHPRQLEEATRIAEERARLAREIAARENDLAECRRAFEMLQDRYNELALRLRELEDAQEEALFWRSLYQELASRLEGPESFRIKP